MADDLIMQILRNAAQNNNVDPALLEAVARQESNFNPKAQSPAGAQGLMQIIPSTQKMLGVTDPFDPEQSANAGAKYLRQQLDAFGGDPAKALAAYNAGPGAVTKYGGVPPYKETQNYVNKIMTAMGQPGQASPASTAMVAPTGQNSLVPGSQMSAGDIPALIKTLQGSKPQMPAIDPSQLTNNQPPMSKTKSILMNVLGGLSTALGTVLSLGESPAGPLLMNTGMSLFDKVAKGKEKDQAQSRLNAFLTNPNIPAPVRNIAGLSQFSPEAAKAYNDASQPTDPAKVLQTVRTVQEIQQNTPEGIAAKNASENTQFMNKLEAKTDYEKKQVEEGINKLANLAVMDPSKMTEKDKFDRNYLMSKYGKSAGIKVLPAATGVQLADIKAGYDQISGLEKEMNDTLFDPISGRARKLNPYQTDTQLLDANLKLVKQVIGKGLEGGVLRKEDEAKYEDILPKLSDTAEVAKGKVMKLRNLLLQKHKTYVDTFSELGFSMDNVKPLTTEESAPQAGGNPNAATLRQKYNY